MITYLLYVDGEICEAIYEGKEEISSVVDKEPVFAKLPSESEIAMRDTAQGTAAVSILISGYIRIEAAPSCPPELFQVLIRTLKENA